MNRRLSNSLVLLFVAAIFAGCNNDDDALIDSELTGRALVYDLVSGSDYNVDGTISFEEKKDGSLRVTIKIGATGETEMHPAHLHYGSFAPDAEMATMFTPVNGETGESITEFSALADGTAFNYEVLEAFDGHVKIHGDDGPNKDVILAYGDIGKNVSYTTNAASFAVCE